MPRIAGRARPGREGSRCDQGGSARRCCSAGKAGPLERGGPVGLGRQLSSAACVGSAGSMVAAQLPRSFSASSDAWSKHARWYIGRSRRRGGGGLGGASDWRTDIDGRSVVVRGAGTERARRRRRLPLPRLRRLDQLQERRPGAAAVDRAGHRQESAAARRPVRHRAYRLRAGRRQPDP
jgi:hypothetical protein